jgi:hypothetical protein
VAAVAGLREEGSPDDFYASLAVRGKAARARYNAEHSPPLSSTTYTADLLPGRDDDLRWRAETAVRTERRLRAVVHDLIRRSLLDGHEHGDLRHAQAGRQVAQDASLGLAERLEQAPALRVTRQCCRPFPASWLRISAIGPA